MRASLAEDTDHRFAGAQERNEGPYVLTSALSDIGGHADLNKISSADRFSHRAVKPGGRCIAERPYSDHRGIGQSYVGSPCHRLSNRACGENIIHAHHPTCSGAEQVEIVFELNGKAGCGSCDGALVVQATDDHLSGVRRVKQRTRAVRRGECDHSPADFLWRVLQGRVSHVKALDQLAMAFTTEQHRLSKSLTNLERVVGRQARHNAARTGGKRCNDGRGCSQLINDNNNAAEGLGADVRWKKVNLKQHGAGG